MNVMSCDQCQHTNTRRFDKTCPELQPIKVQSPWFHIGIDLIGPLLETIALESKHASGVVMALFMVKSNNNKCLTNV